MLSIICSPNRYRVSVFEKILVEDYCLPPPFSDAPTLRINVNVRHLGILLFEIAVQYGVVCNLWVWYLLLIGLYLHFWSCTSRSNLIFILTLVCFSCNLKRNSLNRISNHLIFYHKSKLTSITSKKKILKYFSLPMPVVKLLMPYKLSNLVKDENYIKNMTFLCVKFIYCEKATKFC